MQNLGDNATKPDEPPKLKIPPPPPPPLRFQIPKLKVDPVIQSLIEAHPSNFTSQQEELTKTKSPISEIHAIKSQGTDSANQIVNLTEYKQCTICHRWYHQFKDMATHKEIHSAQILDFLYLGGTPSAENKRELEERIKCGFILNCAQELPNFFAQESQFTYKKLHLKDNFQEDICEVFQECFDFIEKARIQTKNIFIHCAQGKSRSATIVISYLMKHHKMNLQQAYKFVKQKRPIVQPNPNYVRRLRIYQRNLYGINSIGGHEIIPLYRFFYKEQYTQTQKTSQQSGAK